MKPVQETLTTTMLPDGTKLYNGEAKTEGKFYQVGHVSAIVKDGKIAPMSQSGYMPSFMVDRLSDVKKMGAKNIEMENGTIFTVCGLFGLRAGSICTVSDVVPWHPTEKVIDFEQNMADCIRVAVEGMRTLISWDKRKGGARYWTPSMK